MQLPAVTEVETEVEGEAAAETAGGNRRTERSTIPLAAAVFQRPQPGVSTFGNLTSDLCSRKCPHMVVTLISGLLEGWAASGSLFQR